MIAAAEVARIMGITAKTTAEIARAVQRGLPRTVLERTVKRAVSAPEDIKPTMLMIISESTLKRRGAHLKSPESERIERLARLIATAEHVWGDTEKARRFLNTPHPELDGRKPLEAAATEIGARQAEDVLWNLFYGLPV